MLTLPWPPSVNTYWRNFRGHTVLSKAGREFKHAVAEYVAAQQLEKFGDKRLRITLILNPRDKRKIDIDNRVKSVLDSLQDAGMYDDDWQIDELHVYRGEIIKGGRVLVNIEVIE